MSNDLPQSAGKNRVVFDNFSYRFADTEVDVLQHIDLTIEAGDFVVISGPSGCGKSTLALAIGGYLFQQNAGEWQGGIRVFGMDPTEVPIYDLADTVGLVQQDPESQFCTLNVLDEIAFGLENRCIDADEIQEKIDWSLEVVQASHLIDRQLAELSGGEKQKVAIASVLAAQPALLILDEPTSNLDPPSTAELFQVIRDIRSRLQLTVIVIEHKVNYLAEHQPRLVRMEEGCILDNFQPKNFDRDWGDTGRFPEYAHQGETLLEVRDLFAGFDETEILHDISFTADQGEFLVVLGDNGSGKTTLLHTLLGFIRPQKGSVSFHGQDTASMPVNALARDIGLVFQNPDQQIFNETVWDEAVFSLQNFGRLEKQSSGQTRDLLEKAGLSGYLERHPYRLSFGEKRRLNLISVLAYRPDLLLLDELLIGQDPLNAVFLLNLLRDYCQDGGSVIMVTHNLLAVQHYAERILFLEDGGVLFDNSFDHGLEILKATGRDSYLPGGLQGKKEGSS